ncbi:MAG TPA: hypothetical protein EYQ21_06100, partial [Flavobacteriales bacterium]|nr:hypothetical protein [Flavobacteriales bacterium]
MSKKNHTLDSLQVGQIGVFPDESDPSLATLLLGEEQAAAFGSSTKPTVSKKKNVNAAGSTSRKSRRSKATTAGTRVRANRSSSTSSPAGVRTQIQRDLISFNRKKHHRERNERNVQKWQLQIGKTTGKQADQQKSSYSIEKIGKSVDTSTSIEVPTGTRPTILGTFDFHPLYGDTGLDGGELTTTGKLIALSNAVKYLNLEAILDPSEPSTWETFPMEPVAKWFQANKQFQALLDVSSLGNDLTSIFDYLMLDAESAVEASNTEVLMTIMRDAAIVLQGCSPRLLELDERSFEAGTDMPDNIYSESFSVQSALQHTEVFEQILTSLGQFDDDQLMKALFQTLGHECLLSINKNVEKSTSSIDSLFDVSIARRTFMPSTNPSLNCYNMVQYGGEGDIETLFPLEPCDISPDDEVKYASWPDIFRELPFIKFDGGTTGRARSTSNGWDVNWDEVYSNMNEKASKKLSDVLGLLENSWVSDSDGMHGCSYFSEYVLVSCLIAVEDIITAEGTSMDDCSVETAIALWWIDQASSDENMLRCLMLFLADLFLVLTYDPSTSGRWTSGTRRGDRDEGERAMDAPT